MNNERTGSLSGQFRRLLTLLVGLVVMLAGIVSGATNAAAETRVGAQPEISVTGVGLTAAAPQTNVGADGVAGLRLTSAAVVAAETASSLEPLAANGAKLANLTGQDQSIIQAATNRLGRPISVVGSRAATRGGSGMASDYDYVVQGLSNEERTMLRKALPSTYAGQGQQPLIDIMGGQLDETLPSITFYPK